MDSTFTLGKTITLVVEEDGKEENMMNEKESDNMLPAEKALLQQQVESSEGAVVDSWRAESKDEHPGSSFCPEIDENDRPDSLQMKIFQTIVVFIAYFTAVSIICAEKLDHGFTTKYLSVP